MAAKTETKDYAVIRDGGKQYVVSVGDTIFLERKGDVSGDIELADVLAIRKGEEFKAGPAAAAGVVVAEVQGEALGPKTVKYMYKRRKGQHTKKGHRQKYLKVKIKDIQGG